MKKCAALGLSALLWAVPSVSTFAAGKQLTGQHAPSASPALAPADAQKAFSVPPGFEVRLFAAEPDVVNPVAMTWDERGRLWVLELYEYPLGAAPGQKPRDRIKILTDTDNDGRADKVTVFADGLDLATGLLVGNGGVYVGQAPDLLFLQDTNGDDVADKRTVVLTGFGRQDRHELLNGFTWGPDGWLYLTHGVFTFSKVKIPEATEPGVEMTAAVARFHPVTKKFEIFAEGTSNPWGVDFDRNGNAFVSACVIDHLFHMAPGGSYQRQGGTPSNPYTYELLPSIVEHKHHMAAYCGICIYQGDMFPEEYRGRVFMGNIHENAVNHDRLTANGSSFKATAEPNFVGTTDGWFRPVSEQVGPDGALWIADWYDKYPCYQNAQADPEGVDRERGRIWRVVYNTHAPGSPIPSRPEKDMDLKSLPSTNLVKLLEHPNVWQRRVAQRLLQERARQGDLTVIKGEAMTALLNLKGSEKHPVETRLSAFAVLHEIKGIPNFVYWDMGGMMPNADFHGALAARHIGDNRDSSPEALAILAKFAASTNASTRLAVATAVRQLVSGDLTINTPPADANAKVGPILVALIKSSADAKDPLLPYMIWLAAEPPFAKNPAPGLQWLAENGPSTLPLSGILARKSMRRLCDLNDATKLAPAIDFLTQVAATNEALTIAALDGLLEGQRAKPVRPAVDIQPLFKLLNASANPAIQERAQQLGAFWGEAAAVEKSLAIAADAKADASDRIQAIQIVAQLKNDVARQALLKIIAGKNPESVVMAALRGLGIVGGDNVGAEIVKSWNNFSLATRRAGIDVLASRASWAGALLDGVEAKTIAPGEISAAIRRTLAQYKDTTLTARLEPVLGKFRESDADKIALIKEKRKMIISEKPDLAKGHEVAKRACFVCHKLHGEGADVGPDLTGVGRSTLDALLANVIDPNQIVGKGYENVFVETKDERSLGGRLVENTDTHVKLLAAGPTEIVVAKSDIASQRTSELSVMPEGLEQMSDEDFRNLIWYILAPPGDEKPLTPERRRELMGKP